MRLWPKSEIKWRLNNSRSNSRFCFQFLEWSYVRMSVETVTFSNKVRKFLADLQKDVEVGNPTHKRRHTSFWLTLERVEVDRAYRRGFEPLTPRQLMCCCEKLSIYFPDIFPHFSQNYNQCLTQKPPPPHPNSPYKWRIQDQKSMFAMFATTGDVILESRDVDVMFIRWVDFLCSCDWHLKRNGFCLSWVYFGLWNCDNAKALFPYCWSGHWFRMSGLPPP